MFLLRKIIIPFPGESGRNMKMATHTPTIRLHGVHTQQVNTRVFIYINIYSYINPIKNKINVGKLQTHQSQ